MRSTIWVGIFVGCLSLVSILLTDPGYWESATRNIDLVYLFATSLLVSLLSLPSAHPLSIVIERARRQKEPPIPEKIETHCQCGAVFKSNPLICSECGTVLRKAED